MSHTLYSSPLQGFTDFRFRNAFHKYFGGIDTYYAPYIRLDGKFVIKPNYQTDILPENNTTLHVIPQIMTNDADEFLFVVKYIQSLGYTELNWNLGCPYPMVVNRCMGSGLIADPSRIDAILDRVHSESNVTVSMKMRMGYHEPTEILKVIPVLEKYPIKNVAIHARIGKQLYKGGTDLESFKNCMDAMNLPVYYNGDITTVDSYLALQRRFPSIKNWMIGRGILHDPFLAMMIKENLTSLPSDSISRFEGFHEQLFHETSVKLKGEKHVIMKMASYWEYFETGWLADFQREIKKIRKSKTFVDYNKYSAILIEELEGSNIL